MSYAVECLPDEALLSLLLPANRHIIHRSDKPEVLKHLRRNNDAFGMIDEDPDSTQPPMSSQLREVESVPHLGLKLSRFPDGKNVIILSPRLEEWILNECRHVQISLDQYNLPNDSEAFHDVVNQRLDNFRRLISDMLRESARL